MKSITVKKGYIFLSICLSAFSGVAQQKPQEQHQITLPGKVNFVEDNHFKQGTNTSPHGDILSLNNYFLTLSGKPILPIMGEIHYSRYPKAEWEEALLKMKAAGIQVVAFYDFWNHHEEDEGVFRFDDNRDVRYFVELCAKHHLYALARLGPWAHGEARNGGFPEWFLKKASNGFDRVTKNGSIEPEVKRWYGELAKQFKGLYFKDGGPIIGVQVDNEMGARPGNDGYKYLSALKQLAVESGIDVPLYVATGWPGPQIPEDDLMPLWGGYPDAPWTQNIKDLPANKLYAFVTDRRDKNIGNDILNYQTESAKTPFYRHPFLTVELGGGMQMTYHRRPTLKAEDLLGLVYTRLGVGANMLGYYVFHGTQHPLSWHKEYATQETKSGLFPYPNDYPMISYDFQSPITEWGYIRDYYHDFKLMHQFVSSYSETLAPMVPVIPADNPESEKDLEKLRYSVRSSDGAGFVFFNNYVRHFDMADHQNVSFTIKNGTEELHIPESGGVNIKNGLYGVIPFNQNMDGALLKYATAHPATILNNATKTYCFYAMDGITPEFKFDKSTVKSIKTKTGKIQKQANAFLVNQLKPGKNAVIQIETKNGKNIQILLLTKEEALKSYVFDLKGIKTLLLTHNLAYYDEVKQQITIRSVDEPVYQFSTFPALNLNTANLKSGKKDGIFYSYQVNLPRYNASEVTFKQFSADDNLNKYVKSLDGKTPEGPTYNIFFNNRLPYKNYQINMPKAIPASVNDLLLEFNYVGNTAQIYDNGTLISDQYYSGVSMPFSLRRHREALANDNFIFQITPLLPDFPIHFEPKTPLDFVENTPADLKSISVKAQYQIDFKIK
jgi:hypothetical protein